MDLKILKTELAFQFLLSFGSILYIIFQNEEYDKVVQFFIILFFVGIANFVGFVVRISIILSKYNQYYFFGVIAFFLLMYFSFLFSKNYSNDFLIYYLGIGGVLFNIYYLLYGLYLIKIYP